MYLPRCKSLGIPPKQRGQVCWSSVMVIGSLNSLLVVITTCRKDLLENFPGPLRSKVFIKLISRAGFLNLPNWVYPVIGRSVPNDFERYALKKSINLIAIPVREALKDGVAAHSLRRVYG